MLRDDCPVLECFRRTEFTGTVIATGIFVLSGLAVSNVCATVIVAFLIAAIVPSFTSSLLGPFDVSRRHRGK